MPDSFLQYGAMSKQRTKKSVALAYKRANEMGVLVQEEPQNQGAWPFLAMNLPGDLAAHGETRTLRAVTRPASASPAAGTAKKHAAEQAEIIRTAFDR